MYGDIDRFKIFMWEWQSGRWVYHEDDSLPTYATHQEGEQGLASNRVRLSKAAFQPGWWYQGLYYWDNKRWIFEEGERLYVDAGPFREGTAVVARADAGPTAPDPKPFSSSDGALGVVIGLHVGAAVVGVGMALLVRALSRRV